MMIITNAIDIHLERNHVKRVFWNTRISQVIRWVFKDKLRLQTTQKAIYMTCTVFVRTGKTACLRVASPWLVLG